MMSAIEGGGMREYFAPESGRGLGARDFAWTAALCLRELGAVRRVARAPDLRALPATGGPRLSRRWQSSRVP